MAFAHSERRMGEKVQDAINLSKSLFQRRVERMAEGASVDQRQASGAHARPGRVPKKKNIWRPST